MSQDNTDFSISYHEAGRYIHLRFLAPITRELAQRCARANAELDAQVHAKGFLIDSRDIANIEDVYENFAFAMDDLDKAGFPRDKRSAILVNPDDASHDFPLTAMREAGYNVRMFTDEQKAIAWLEEPHD